jgi:MoaA/NifB/PqqE/SkfB family radical SAM enzyme
MAALGIKEVTLIGGEAYLRPDWLTIVAAVRKHGMFCSMTTGGRGITRERATQAVAAGLQSAAVSLDGTAATHDRQRALNGSFSAGVRALEFLREAGIPVSVNTQINAWSWRELPELLDVLIEQHAHAWQLQLTVPMGRAADRGIFAGNNVGYFGPHEELLRRYMPEQHRGSCGAGKVVLGLEANGTVKGCPSISYASRPPIARRLRRPSSEHLRRDRTSWLHSSSAPLVVVTSGVATPSARSAVLNGSRPQAPRGKEWRATPHARRWSHSA